MMGGGGGGGGGVGDLEEVAGCGVLWDKAAISRPQVIVH